MAKTEKNLDPVEIKKKVRKLEKQHKNVLILSEIYAIDNNVADIVTESFGDCETNYPVGTAVTLNAIREQAAAQGITFLVASGDTGVAGCDAQTQTTATGGISVNILASSPYNIAVGGTQFNEHGVPSQYWAASNGANFASALSPIPRESPWPRNRGLRVTPSP